MRLPTWSLAGVPMVVSAVAGAMAGCATRPAVTLELPLGPSGPGTAIRQICASTALPPDTDPEAAWAPSVDGLTCAVVAGRLDTCLAFGTPERWLHELPGRVSCRQGAVTVPVALTWVDPRPASWMAEDGTWVIPHSGGGVSELRRLPVGEVASVATVPALDGVTCRLREAGADYALVSVAVSDGVDSERLACRLTRLAGAPIDQAVAVVRYE